MRDGTPRLRDARLIAATDVDNPLLGLHGASNVFGPQKGADRADVLLLDAALGRWAEVLERDLPGCPSGLGALPGGGAAGGAGAGLLALGGRCESGIGLVSRVVELDTVLDEVDLVVTGEGRFDHQSLRGKVVAGVAGAARDRGVPCVVLAGQVSTGRREAASVGVTDTYSLVEHFGGEERGGLAAALGCVSSAPGWPGSGAADPVRTECLVTPPGGAATGGLQSETGPLWESLTGG